MSITAAVRKFFAGLAIFAGFGGLSTAASALPISQIIDIAPSFVAPEQSYFGPGRIEGTFDFSGTVGSSGLGLSFFATSGSGNVSGALDTAMRLTAPTVVHDRRFFVDYDWLQTNLGFNTTFLAGFGLDLHFLGATVPIVDRSVSMSTGVSGLPFPPGVIKFAGPGLSDCEDISAISINVIVGSASVGGSLCAAQFLRFKVAGIEGSLRASQAGQLDQIIEFSFGSETGKIPVGLPALGTWDFSFGDFALLDQFGSRIIFQGGVFGEVCVVLFGCDTERRLGKVGDIGGNTFPLTWDSAPVDETFQVTLLPVAEPAALPILAIGLFGICLARRRGMASTVPQPG